MSKELKTNVILGFTEPEYLKIDRKEFDDGELFYGLQKRIDQYFNGLGVPDERIYIEEDGSYINVLVSIDSTFKDFMEKLK